MIVIVASRQKPRFVLNCYFVCVSSIRKRASFLLRPIRMSKNVIKKRGKLSFIVIMAFIAIFIGSGQVSSEKTRKHDTGYGVVAPGPIRLIALDPKPKRSYVAPPNEFWLAESGHQERAKGATSSIVVNYFGGGWTQAAKDAFRFAADIWETQIESNVPIIVDAEFEIMDPGILGGAGPTEIWRDFTGAPQIGTWYPVGLANKLANKDLNPSISDIRARFSQNYPNWYFGTDANMPGNQINFISVALHELGHGLGFIGSMRVDDGSENLECIGVTNCGLYGYSGYPMIYDRFTENGAGIPLLDFENHSMLLGKQLTSNDVYFDGQNARSANAGLRVPIYAPSSWKPGSSYSHLAESYNGTDHALMTFSISAGETIHHPGEVTLGLFTDMGWSIFTPPSPPPIQNGNFEQGRNAWIEQSVQFPYLIVSENELIANNRPVRSHSGGQWVAWLGGGDEEISTLSQQIKIPSDHVYLHYWHWIDSFEDTCDSEVDGAFVLVNAGGGDNTLHSYALCSGENTAGWLEVVVDLTAYSDTELTLTFEVRTNADQYSELFLDTIFLAPYPLLEEKTYLPLAVRK